jgi:hypothetical protein
MVPPGYQFTENNEKNKKNCMFSSFDYLIIQIVEGEFPMKYSKMDKFELRISRTCHLKNQSGRTESLGRYRLFFYY